MADQFLIKFAGVPMRDANQLAESLRNELLAVDPEVRAETVRESKETMDFGGTLVLVLGTPAVTLVARAILKWAARTNTSSIRLERPDGTLIADRLESKDVPSLVKAFSNARSSSDAS